jgi:hypothetical protein
MQGKVLLIKFLITSWRGERESEREREREREREKERERDPAMHRKHGYL